MPGAIDCSMMSHAACLEPDQPDGDAPQAAEQGLPSYECVNECVSSLGVSTLVGGAVTSLGCLLVSAGSCAVLIGAAAGSVLGACGAACDELESKP